MKFVLSELNKLVDLSNKSTDELIDIFTALAFEVEEIYPAADVDGIKLTTVENCVKHPEADKLNYLQSTINGETLDVVCGGANIATGQIVAHAYPGTRVGEMTMAPKELRGITSNGMILSIGEIAGINKSLIEDEEAGNIVVFPEGTDLNSDPVELLGLKGDVIDLSILTDRQYAANYFAMARDVATYIGSEYNWDIEEVERNIENNSTVELGELANSIYSTNVTINKEVRTPLWIKTVLYHAGIKPTNNIQDVSTYAMLITGAITYIVDRKDTYKLDDRKFNELDIFESEALQTEGTEVAFVTIGSDKRANFVNERNLNSTFGSRAIKGTNTEAAELTSRFVLAIAKKAGFISQVSNTVSKVVLNDRQFEIEDSYVFGYLGKEFDINEVASKLSKLGIVKEGNVYNIPSYRKDIEFKADVVEEIARIYGVENIEPKEYEISNDIFTPEGHKEALIKITDVLPQYGLAEVKTYQLVTEKEAVDNNIWGMEKFVQLRSDYKVEYNTLQTSLFSGLIESFKLNHRNDKEDIRLFELSNIFHNEKPVYSLGILHDEKIHEEDPILATKELVLKSIESLGISADEITFESAEQKLFNPFISSQIRYNSKVIGLIGEVHPSLLREHKFIRLDKVKAKLYYAELKIEELI